METFKTMATLRHEAGGDNDSSQPNLFDQRGNQLRWLRQARFPAVMPTKFGTVSGAAAKLVLRSVDEIIGKSRCFRIRIATLTRVTELSRSTVLRAIEALKTDAVACGLVAEGRADPVTLRDALAECGMPLLAVTPQYSKKGRSPHEFKILWPAVRVLAESGPAFDRAVGIPKKPTGCASVGSAMKPTLFHDDTAVGLSKKPASFLGETSLPAQCPAPDLPAHLPRKVKTPAEQLYDAYPRHEGKDAALKAIERALGKEDFDTLLTAVLDFARSPKGQAGEFCPMPATWFNQGRWKDDRSKWQYGSGRAATKGKFNAEPYQQFIAEANDNAFT
jgi:hypothetical protein